MFFFYLRRGVLAGLFAGLLAGLFAYLVGEPVIERALLLEADGHATQELVSREGQKVGLVAATALYGGAVGCVFAVVFSWFSDRAASGSGWSKSLRLAFALSCGVFFLPFLKYPSDPPGTGDPETVGVRTAAYLLCVAISCLSVLGAWYVSRYLEGRGSPKPVRQTAVGAALVVALGAAFVLLPPATPVGDFPGQLLWDFRLSTLATQVVLWGALGVVFGYLCERRAEPGFGKKEASAS